MESFPSNIPAQIPTPPPSPTVPTSAPPEENFRQKKRPNNLFLLKVVVILILPLVGILATFFLTRSNQDIRQQASQVYPSPTIIALAQKKQNNERCTSNSDCASDNCLAVPGGKFCVETGVSLGKVAEGQRCATNAYDRECATGLTCHQNKCVKPENIEKTPIGSCLTEGSKCEGNRGYSDSSCAKNIRCGTAPQPTKTPTPTTTTSQLTGSCSTLSCPTGLQRQVETTGICSCVPPKKANNERCSSNSDCVSNNCLAVPGGKFCVEAGVSLGKIKEGQTCATNAYDRECDTGLTCSNNRCVKPSEVVTTPVGSCLGEGQSCQGGRGYSDSTCGGRNIRCGTATVGGKQETEEVEGATRCVGTRMVEEYRNGQWNFKESCYDTCDVKTNSCRMYTPEELVGQGVIRPEDIEASPYIFENDLEIIKQYPDFATMRTDIEGQIQTCIQNGGTQAQCQQRIEQVFQTVIAQNDSDILVSQCMAGHLLRGSSAGLDSIQGECREAAKQTRTLVATMVLAPVAAPLAEQALAIQEIKTAYNFVRAATSIIKTAIGLGNAADACSTVNYQQNPEACNGAIFSTALDVGGALGGVGKLGVGGSSAQTLINISKITGGVGNVIGVNKTVEACAGNDPDCLQRVVLFAGGEASGTKDLASVVKTVDYYSRDSTQQFLASLIQNQAPSMMAASGTFTVLSSVNSLLSTSQPVGAPSTVHLSPEIKLLNLPQTQQPTLVGIIPNSGAGGGVTSAPAVSQTNPVLTQTSQLTDEEMRANLLLLPYQSY